MKVALDKIYTTLCVLFAVLIVMGNLIYKKFVFLPVLSFHTFELSVGAIVYPLTFMITDLIAEFYGKYKASFCVKVGMAMNVMVAGIIAIMDKLDATAWSLVDNAIFHRVFGHFSIAFLGSVIACYIAQFFDIRIYLWIRKLTGEKLLWLRNSASTAVSLLIDTCIVIVFMTALDVLPKSQMWKLVMNSYMFKLFYTVCGVPLFYAGVGAIRRMTRK